MRLRILLALLLSASVSADHHLPETVPPCGMSYPNLEGDLLINNDQVVVQKFTIQPGQWEGIHSHPPNQLYIQLTGGDWRYKSGSESDDFHLPAGSVSWNETATDISMQHESGNIGEQPITYLWVAIKPGCNLD